MKAHRSTKGRNAPRGGASQGHSGTQGSGQVQPKARGTQSAGAGANCKAKGAQGRGG